MDTLQELKRKIKSAQDLHGVVRTMKTLAAVNIRQYDQAVAVLGEYYRAVELGLRAALSGHASLKRDAPPTQMVVLIFGSDQGMAGGFNEAVVDFAAQTLSGGIPAENVNFWIAGGKASAVAKARFGSVDQTFALPSSAESITASVREIVLRFERRRQEQGETRLLLFYNAPLSGLLYTQRHVPLLPPDREWLEDICSQKWVARSLPFYTLPWERLFAALIDEYLFISLFQSIAASLAAENAARLAAMQRAENNLREKKESLSARYNAVRQSLITEELLDIIAGFEALQNKDLQYLE